MVTEITAAENEVQGEYDEVLALGNRIQGNRQKLAILLHRLYHGEVNGMKKYQHLGFHTAEEMLQSLATRLQPTSRTLGNWRSTLLLEESTVRNLELSKCYQAARLKRAGAWKSKLEEKWKGMTLEAVKDAVRKILSPLAEGRRKLTFVIADTLFQLWEDQLERVRQATGITDKAVVFEYMLSELQHKSSDKSLRAAMGGQGA